MGLGETIIYCSLGKGYLYVGVSLHSLCGFYLVCVCVFVRAIFDWEAYLFSQCVLALIVLIGDLQVHGLCAFPRRWRQRLTPGCRGPWQRKATHSPS